MSRPDEPHRPRILDALGAELVRAARAHERASGTGEDPVTPGRRTGWRAPGPVRLPRAVVLGCALLLLLAAVAIGASLVIGRGDDLPPPPAGAVPRELQPVPGSAHLAGLDVADPDGGPPWDVRTSRSRTGALCTTVGQVLDGELGIVGLDRRFRALPAGAADTCSTPQRHGATLAGARGFRGGAGFTDLTVVNGVAAPAVRAAEVVAGGRRTPLRLAPSGAFLAVFRGLPDTVRPRLLLTESGGRRTILRFADTGEYLAPDPHGGTPWTLTTQTARVPGLRCVGARRERGPDSPEPLARDLGAFNFSPSATPVRCGRLETAFVIARRFVPVAPRRGGSVDPWGINPARTVVVGAVPRAGAQVVVDGIGVPRRTVRVDQRTHGFLAVFDGHIDPRRLRIWLDGRRLRSMAGAVGLRGQPLAPVGAPPPWRSVRTVARRASIFDPFIPDRGTVRLVRRAADPTGGPPWTLRSWSAVVDPRLHPAGTERRMLCFAAGILRHGALAVPRPAAPPRPLDFGEGDAACTFTRWLTTHAAGPQITIYADDAASADPHPARVVVAGLLGDGVRAASLLGAGRPRPLHLGPRGTYLLVLGPEAAAHPLHVRQVRADGTVRTAPALPTTPSCATPAARTARVADPAGGAPWMMGRGRTATMSCFFLARVVRGRPAWIDEASGVMRFGEVLGARSATGIVRHLHIPPVRLEVHGLAGGPLRPAAEPPSPTQSARRALEGRTVVLGRTTAEVVSVTLRTPRDIRTVTPVGGAFLAVYDGAFYGGAVVATARLRDGRTVTAHVPASTPW